MTVRQLLVEKLGEGQTLGVEAWSGVLEQAGLHRAVRRKSCFNRSCLLDSSWFIGMQLSQWPILGIGDLSWPALATSSMTASFVATRRAGGHQPRLPEALQGFKQYPSV